MEQFRFRYEGRFFLFLSFLRCFAFLFLEEYRARKSILRIDRRIRLALARLAIGRRDIAPRNELSYRVYLRRGVSSKFRRMRIQLGRLRGSCWVSARGFLNACQWTNSSDEERRDAYSRLRDHPRTFRLPIHRATALSRARASAPSALLRNHQPWPIVKVEIMIAVEDAREKARRRRFAVAKNNLARRRRWISDRVWCTPCKSVTGID